VQRGAVVAAIRATVAAHGNVQKRRYGCMNIETIEDGRDGLVSVLTQLADRAAEIHQLLCGRADVFGDALKDVKGWGALNLLDVARSIQLASGGAAMLLAADVLPTKLDKQKGTYKRIAPVFKQVVGRDPTPEEAEQVLRVMQTLNEPEARRCWDLLCTERPEERLADRWTPAVAKLYFRVATLMDMEMLGCEIGKVEAGERWKRGECRQPSKGYFEIVRDWGDWARVFEGRYGYPLLAKVPLCTLRCGEVPGGVLQSQCIDLRPVD
jgi:hypothetical protein